MSSCAQKVRIVLAEKDLDWLGIHLSLRAGESRTEDYKKLNPKGVVPTLITEDSKVLIESTVIMEYLDDAYPKRPLKPVNPVARAQMRLWTKQLDEGVHASLATVSNAIAFRYQHLENRSEEQLKAYFDGIPDPERLERTWHLTMNGIKSHYFEPSVRRFDKLFGDMEQTLNNEPWLAGKHYSLADIAYIPYVTRFDHLQLLGMLDERPKLQDWYRRVKILPSYAKGIGKWLNVQYLSLMKEKGEEAWPHVKKIILPN